MRIRLFFKALMALLVGLTGTAALLFVPAGTIAYARAWLLLGVLFIPMALAGAAMLIRNPLLLEKRLKTKEKQAEQRGVIACSFAMFVLGFVLAGLDFRFGWTALPLWVSCLAGIVFLLGYVLYAQVLRQNMYASRVVEIQEGQELIDTGLYGVVRHPMYSATLLLFLSMPLVLGSGISLLCFIGYPLLLVRRISSEEGMLAQGLAGYEEYMRRVPYRLIPFVW